MRLLSLAGGWLFYVGFTMCSTGCAKKFDITDSAQHAVPAPVITGVVYDQAMNITGSNFDSLLSQVNVGGDLALGFTYQYNSGTGVQTLHNPQYKPASGLDNPAPITVTVKGETSNAWSYLFYPVVADLSRDTAFGANNFTIKGTLFGSRKVASSVKAFYYDAGFNQIYMSPDPTVISWTTNAIQVTMPLYSSYPTGRPLLSFQIYLEVDVSTKNSSSELLYIR